MFCSKIDMFGSVFIRLHSRYESLVKTKQKTKTLKIGCIKSKKFILLISSLSIYLGSGNSMVIFADSLKGIKATMMYPNFCLIVLR